MAMSVAEPAPRPSFWRTWRRELIRGGALFGLVVGAGLFIREMFADMPKPWGILSEFGDFEWGDGNGGNLFGTHREVGEPWEFRTELNSSQHVWIRNTNGPIEVVAGDGPMLEVIAEKSWRHSNPANVELVAVPSARGVTICALWDARERRCGEGGDYRLNGVRKNDVAVRFHVMLPAGVPLEATTVNGELQIDGVEGPVEVGTVNGKISVNSAGGPVEASTVNGSIEAILRALSGGDIRLTTVNGSVSAGFPAGINATLDAATVNGRVDTDFPVKISGKISTRHLRGTIGDGGPVLKLSTVNGSISIHEAHVTRAAPAHRAPRPARTARPPRAPVTQVAPTPPADSLR